MTNRIIPEAEVNAVKKVIKAVEDLKVVHSNCQPNFKEDSTELEQLHTVTYIHFIGDLLGSATALKTLLESSEEEFEKFVTHNGEHSVSDILVNAMIVELEELLK